MTAKKKLTQIKRWDNDEVIHECKGTIKDVLEDGVSKNIDFYRARLDGARLDGAIYNGIKVKFLWSLGRLYTYNAIVAISEDNILYVGMGCHFRKAYDWQKDFWNNLSEFPDDGSIKTQERVMACKFAIEFGILHDGEVKA